MDTACSSSLVAMHLAATGLAYGEARASVAAGVNLMLVPDTSIHMAALGALSPTGRYSCRAPARADIMVASAPHPLDELHTCKHDQ